MVGIFRTKVEEPLAWVQLPTTSVLTAKLPGPVTGFPLTVPVQVAVPVSPWEVEARWRSCGVKPGWTAVVTVMVQVRLATGAAAVAGAAGVGRASGRGRG